MEPSFSANGNENSIYITEIPDNATVYSCCDLSTMKSSGVVVINSELLYQGNWDKNHFVDNVTVVSIKENKLLSVYSVQDNKIIENIKQSDVKQGKCFIDDGEILWVGDVVSNVACGYGSILKHSDNSLIYKGFRIMYNNVCFGEYYQSGQKLYKGIICNDKKFGMDFFSGNYYIDNKCISTTNVELNPYDSPIIPSLIESLVISNFMFNTSSNITLSCFPNLNSLVIKDNCYNGNENGVCCLSSLPKLVSVSIGTNSLNNVSVVMIKSKSI